MTPQTPSSGFLDLNLSSSWKIKRLSNGKKEIVTEKRRKELQTLLTLLLKEIGPPCKTYHFECASCKAWEAFQRIDAVFTV